MIMYDDEYDDDDDDDEYGDDELGDLILASSTSLPGTMVGWSTSQCGCILLPKLTGL